MNPISPLFAIEAEQMLLSDLVEDAINLCKKGLEIYPDYPIAFVILARAYEKAGNQDGLHKLIKEATSKFPQNKLIKHLKSKYNIKEENADEFFDSDKFSSLVENISNAKIPVQIEDEMIPEDNDTKTEPLLITETMADIYVKQGLYDVAIKAYQALSEQYPEKAPYFFNKISETIKQITPI